MTERAKKIMRAYKAEDTYNFPNDGVAAAIRAVAEEVYFTADVELLNEIADEVEALDELAQENPQNPL